MSKESDYIVIGHFPYADDTEVAINKLRDAGHKDDVELYSPVPNHDLEDVLYQDRVRSPVRRFTLLGGLTGLSGAFLMCIWMSMDYPLRVSSKPVISIPAFVIVAFECTILLGAIFTLLSMFHFSKIPNLFRFSGFRPNFTEGTFGLTVRVPKSKSDSIKDLLESSGASKVEVEYVR